MKFKNVAQWLIVAIVPITAVAVACTRSNSDQPDTGIPDTDDDSGDTNGGDSCDQISAEATILNVTVGESVSSKVVVSADPGTLDLTAMAPAVASYDTEPTANSLAGDHPYTVTCSAAGTGAVTHSYFPSSTAEACNTMVEVNCTLGCSSLDCSDQNADTIDACFDPATCAHLSYANVESSAELLGNDAGGTLFPDRCPNGEVMVGVSGSVGAAFDQMQVVCGTPAIAGDLTFTIGAGTTLDLRGKNTNPTQSANCPANQVLVGIDGAEGALVDSVALRCATIAINANDNTFTIGTPTTGTPIGGNGGTPLKAPIDCPAGKIVVGGNIRAGGSVDALGIMCGTPTITLQ